MFWLATKTVSIPSTRIVYHMFRSIDKGNPKENASDKKEVVQFGMGTHLCSLSPARLKRGELIDGA